MTLRRQTFRRHSFALTLAAAVTGLAGGSAGAQTPPTTIVPPNDAIPHGPSSPSSPIPPASSAQWQLTTAQKTAILTAVRKDSKSASPVNFVVAVGAPVPPSIELYMLPDVALADTLPPLKVPVAPLAGAVNVTLTPATGWPPESVTFAARLVAKGVLTVALCGVPATAATAAGGLVGAAVSTTSWGALAPDSRLAYVFWLDDTAFISKL